MGKQAEEEYEVEYINSHRITGKNKKKLSFEIKWKGYPADQNTWETSESTENAQDLVDQYWAIKGGGAAARARCERILNGEKSDDDEEEENPRSTRSSKKKPTTSEKPLAPSKKRKLLPPKKVEKIEYTSDNENDEFSESEIENENFRLKGNWKSEAAKVMEVRTVTTDGKKELYGLVRWRDGKIGLYKTSEIGQRIPQKLIKFYENKLSFEEKNR